LLFLGIRNPRRNIVVFETSLHDLLHGFDPFWKFWSTKVLISVAFIQTIVLQVVFVQLLHLSLYQTSLLYSSLICFEVFAIAILNLYAWDPLASWYDDEWPPVEVQPDSI
jgi:hypothetical protein